MTDISDKLLSTKHPDTDQDKYSCVTNLEVPGGTPSEMRMSFLDLCLISFLHFIGHENIE